MANGVARARLRPGKDDDIQEALDEATRTQDESDVVRAALRLYFDLEGMERDKRQITRPKKKEPTTDRPARPGPPKIVKPTLVPTSKEEAPPDTDSALDNLLGF